MAGTETTPDFKGTLLEANLSMTSTGLTVGTHENYPVKITADGQVGLPSIENKFFGVVRVIEDDAICSVQAKGVAELAYTGTVGVGLVELVANGSGGVKAPATPGTGIEYWVLRDDEDNDLVQIILG